MNKNNMENKYTILKMLHNNFIKYAAVIILFF